jgi:hypothetical protein
LFFSDEEFDVVEESNGHGEELDESVSEVEADQSKMMRTKSSAFPTLKQQQQSQQLDETEYSNDYENAGSSRDEGDDNDDDEDNESYSRIVYDRPEDDEEEEEESVDEGNYKSSKILSFAG